MTDYHNPGTTFGSDFDRAVLRALESLEDEADYQSDTPRPYTTEDDIARRWLRDMVRGALHRAAAASRARITMDRRIVEWTTGGVEG
jgi:hypothetical protein